MPRAVAGVRKAAPKAKVAAKAKAKAAAAPKAQPSAVAVAPIEEEPAFGEEEEDGALQHAMEAVAHGKTMIRGRILLSKAGTQGVIVFDSELEARGSLPIAKAGTPAPYFFTAQLWGASGILASL